MSSETAAVAAADAAQAAQRRARRLRRRAGYHAGLLAAASSPQQRLWRATEYLRSVATDLPDADTDQIAWAVAELADEWNGADDDDRTDET